MIDDCSTDDTLNIVESFKKFINIRIIKLPENKGVGNARQIGLDANDCEFVCFLDSDDTFFPYTTTMYNREMRIGFPEVVYSDFISEQKGKEVLLKGKTSITWFHGKVYSKAFLDKYEIKIPQVRFNEDSGFSTIVHELSDKKVYIPEVSYYWRSNPNSITHGSTDFLKRSIPNFVQAIQVAFHHIEKYKHDELWSTKALYGQLNNFYNYHMRAIYEEEPWVPDIEVQLKEFFKEFWIEEKIRPKLLVKGLNLNQPLEADYLYALTPTQWINQITGMDYTVHDFKVIEDKK